MTAPIQVSAGLGPVQRRCSAMVRRTGTQCKGWAMKGQAVCRMHGGATPQARRSAARRLALGAAEAELAKMGRPLDTEPAEAMLSMVREAAGNVAFLRTKVEALSETLGPGGLAGHTGNERITNESAPHVWVAMYDAERDRLVKWAKACRDAGVDERRVEIAESQGHQLAAVLRSSFDAFFLLLREGVPWETVQREHTPGIVRRAIETTVREES